MNVTVRTAMPGDVPAIVAMVHELAEFEREPESCHLTEAQLHTALFAEHPAVFGHVAVTETGEVVGMAIWFVSFSTWEGIHGLYLEDLYVRPAARGTGAGRALMATLAAVCLDRGYERFEWAVLEWNPAREFYAALGAFHKSDWLPYRLSGEPLRTLAAHATTFAPTP